MTVKTWTTVMVLVGGLIACGGTDEGAETDGADVYEAPDDDVDASEPPTDDVDASEPPTDDVDASEPPTDEVDASEPPADDVSLPDVSVTPDVESVDDATMPTPDVPSTSDAPAPLEDSVSTDVTPSEPDVDEPCVSECAGKTCGDDGCGGSCGVCGDGETCNLQGVCETASGCTPACAGKNCGDDGCGGVCGACPTGDICTAGICCDPGPHNDCECWTDADCTAISDACEGAETCNDTGSCDQVPDSALECDEGLLCIDSACVDCDPSGVWEMQATSASPPGEGCGPDGGPALVTNTQIYALALELDGSISVTPVDVEPEPEVTVSLIAGDPCSFAFSVTGSVDVPASDDQEPGTVVVQYLYTGALNDGLYLGTGTVHSTVTTDAGIVQTDCTEAISVSGTFTADDQGG